VRWVQGWVPAGDNHDYVHILLEKLSINCPPGIITVRTPFKVVNFRCESIAFD